jgi:hypothetical protein
MMTLSRPPKGGLDRLIRVHIKAISEILFQCDAEQADSVVIPFAECLREAKLYLLEKVSNGLK